MFKKYILALLSYFLLFACEQETKSDNLIRFELKNGLIGFKKSNGEIVIPPKYIFAYDFTNKGLASVIKEGGNWTRINKKGFVVEVPYVVDNAPDTYSEGLARFVSEDTHRVGFSDEKGNAIIPPKYDWASPFKNGKAIVCIECYPQIDIEYTQYLGGKWGAINRNGEVIVPITHTKEEIYKRYDISQ